MPWDRVWAIAHEAARIEPASRAWAACANFTRGAKSPELMAIRAAGRRGGRAGDAHAIRGRPPITVDPDAPEDAARLVAWVTPLSAEGRARPAFVVRADVGMTDSDYPSISILNRASLAALGDRLGRPLAMERFRGNLWLDGLAPFEEFDLVGARAHGRRRDAAGARAHHPLQGDDRRSRDRGRRRRHPRRRWRRAWGHQDFGVYAEVTQGGRIAVGDGAEPLIVTSDRGAAVELVTERLRLRRPAAADLPRMHRSSATRARPPSGRPCRTGRWRSPRHS